MQIDGSDRPPAGSATLVITNRTLRAEPAESRQSEVERGSANPGRSPPALRRHRAKHGREAGRPGQIRRPVSGWPARRTPQGVRTPGFRDNSSGCSRLRRATATRPSRPVPESARSSPWEPQTCWSATSDARLPRDAAACALSARPRPPAGEVLSPGPCGPPRSAAECRRTASRAPSRSRVNPSVFATDRDGDDAESHSSRPRRERLLLRLRSRPRLPSPHFRSVEPFRGVPPSATRPRETLSRGLMFAGHGIPVSPGPVRAVRYVLLSPTIPLCRPIGQILVQPSSRAARIDPMHPAIQAIPTFGISSRC